MAPARLQLERDLYFRLLELGAREDLAPLLEEALALIVEVTGARKGYLAVFAPGESGDAPPFWIARGCSAEDVDGIRRSISSGVIAEAVATGRTVMTPSALDDPRFRDNRSVQAHGIGAVVCAPVGGSSPIGVLYLQDREPDGSFTDEDRACAETFARHLAPLVDRLAMRRRRDQDADPTRPLRQRMRVDALIGRSAALAEVLGQVESAARFDVSVLLGGPSGSGKTALARAIHEHSPRADKPFVELNCAALPEPLFESELFGAVPGAHSTATRRLPGKLAAAQGGTLFLDEIGELSLGVQAKLLQVLQAKEYYPLGSARPEKSDARVIAATNADLQAAVEARTFRGDLFYRLNVFVIRVPGLDERREDVALLAQHFCAASAAKHQLPALTLGRAALRAIEAADWPGHVRQLAHVVETAAIRAAVERSPVVEPRHVFPEPKGEATADARPLLFQEATRRFQKQFVLEALEAASWNVSEAARRMGLSRAHVHNLIQAFELRR